MVKKYHVIIPADLKPRPKPHEESAAAILAIYFGYDVLFIKTGSRETPDVLIGGVEWEIKSPIGSTENNIQKNMREASRQSLNVVVDLRRSKLHQIRALGYVRIFVARHRRIHRVLVIEKSGNVIVIK
jgi:hypothetical protein